MNVKVIQDNCTLEINQVDIGKEEAIRLYETKFWTDKTSTELALFQMFHTRLIMPWDIFQTSMEVMLGRPVFTHEFGSKGITRIRLEMLGKVDPPTIQEIIGLLPGGESS